ncbi:hypothetical protein HZS_3166, partial [Henneguya salminicola]
MKLRVLQEKIISQELTLQYLRDQGLILISQRCPKCQKQMILRKVSDGEDYVFYKRTCRTSRSIRHGSFFSSLKLDLNQIVLLLHLWSKIYPPEIIMKDFEFSKQTITDWSRFCRDLAIEYFEGSMASKIGGENRVVEIEESTTEVVYSNNSGCLGALKEIPW